MPCSVNPERGKYGLWKHGAYARNRTGDLILTKDALYQLSYVGIILINLSRFPEKSREKRKFRAEKLRF